MKLIYNNRNKILIFLIIISIISFINSVNKGFLNGCDFQWQPALLFWEGINHYSRFMDNGKYEFLCQGGEYAQLLNIIYYPYTLVEWEVARVLWVFTNIFFTFAIPLLICKKFQIPKYKTVILILIFMTCSPTRMTINYGQQSLLVLFFLCLPFISKSNFSYFFSGLSFVKYSTGYVLFLNFLAKKEFKKLFLASILYLLGWLFYFLYTNSNPIINFFEPIQWSLQQKYIRQVADIYSLLQIYFFSNFSVFFKFLSIVLIFILNLLILIKINKLADNFLKMSLIMVCPLIFFPHSNYDYVLLFPLVCHSLLNFEKYLNKVNFFFVIYFFFFHRLVKHLIDLDWLYQPILLTFMIMLLFINIRVNLKNNENL